MNDMSKEINTREHPNTREVSTREFNRFVNTGLKDVNRTLTRREFLKGAAAATAATLMLATGCSNSEAEHIVTPIVEETPITDSETGFAPAPTKEAGFTLEGAEFIDEAGLFRLKPKYEEGFEGFQKDVMVTNESLVDPEFSAFGVRVDTNEGPIVYAFWGVDDTENGGPSFIAMPQPVIVNGERITASVALEWMEIGFEDGDEVLTVLAQTEDPFGNDLGEDALVLFAFDHSFAELNKMLEEDENQTVDARFSPFGQAASPVPTLTADISGFGLLKMVQPENIVSDSEIIEVGGEEISVPKEAFKDMKLNGDTVTLKTVQLEEGTVDYFQLENEEWVAPIEVQKNPDNIDEYVEITAEDVWSGRVLFSEILEAEDEPFPPGTLVPVQFFHHRHGSMGGALVLLVDQTDQVSQYDRNELTYENDHRRWYSFYLIDGKTVVGTQRILSPDGKSSLFFHIGFDRDMLESDLGSRHVMESVFKARENGGSWMFPIIYLDAPCEKATITNSGDNSACVFIDSPGNIPSAVSGDLEERYKEILEGNRENNGAGQEIIGFQSMILPGIILDNVPGK